MLTFVNANTQEEYEAAKQLFREYAISINIDLGFQHFEEELDGLKQMYSAPAGGIILCKEDKDFIGCVAIRKIDEEAGELKRMYVKPGNQGKGVGAGLLAQAIILAKSCGYKKIRLDTLNYMLPAIHLYKKAGFHEIPAYYFNPNTTAVFFEMTL